MRLRSYVIYRKVVMLEQPNGFTTEMRAFPVLKMQREKHSWL